MSSTKVTPGDGPWPYPNVRIRHTDGRVGVDWKGTKGRVHGGNGQEATSSGIGRGMDTDGCQQWERHGRGWSQAGLLGMDLQVKSRDAKA